MVGHCPRSPKADVSGAQGPPGCGVDHKRRQDWFTSNLLGRPFGRGHGVMVIYIKCKNELSKIICELVSYVSSSFKERLNGEHRALLRAWGVPALGMTHIGEWMIVR